ncbi:MAG TPA: carboxypeptidase-like regulatory domain-containing protein, partial [Acidimicrobiia bacterium]|nr:carboxypeptidase-like regulatory domain-containing protein [Acidimicrobiia bacterium]
EQARPLADARVCLCDSKWRDGDAKPLAAYALARTAGDGVARFAAAAAQLDMVVVLANGRRPVQAERSVVAGEQAVVVDQQLSITGVVLVDGGRPGESIELTACAGKRGDTWCDAARAALAPFDPDKAAGSAIADAAGRFAFFGLTPQTEYSIQPLVKAFKRPGTESEPAVMATPLAVDVVLQLERMPLIRGRPVLPVGVPSDGREQVWINPRFVMANGWSELGATPCRIGEQFTIAVVDSAYSEVRPDTKTVSTVLEFRFGRGKASPVVATRTVACPFDGVHDLGNVVLEDPRADREVRIVDRAGAPIAGARVISLGLVSAPAGTDGIVRVAVGPPPATIVAGARGFRIRSVDVTDTSARPLDVVLEPANRLGIEARVGAAAQPRSPMLVSLVFAGMPRDHDFGDRKAVSELRGAKLVMTVARGDEVEYVLELPASGVLDLFDLPSALEFTVKLCDGFGHPIEARSVTMGTDERRDLRFVLAQPPRCLAGQVVDREGQPLRGVEVHVGRSFDELLTDADGRFRVEGVCSDKPSLRFDKVGFRQLMVTGAQLFDRTTFRLERAN